MSNEVNLTILPNGSTVLGWDGDDLVIELPCGTSRRVTCYQQRRDIVAVVTDQKGAAVSVNVKRTPF